MKILLPLVVVGLVLAGFVSACLAAFLAPSSDYIMSQLVTTSETTTQIQTTQIFAILLTETTTLAAPEGTTSSEVLSDQDEVIEE